MAQEYGKRAHDLTVQQLESEVRRVISETVPPDATKNMSISKIEEAHMSAIRGLGFIDIFPDVKCKLVCKAVYPPGSIECTLECSFGFLAAT